MTPVKSYYLVAKLGGDAKKRQSSQHVTVSLRLQPVYSVPVDLRTSAGLARMLARGVGMIG